MRRGKAVDRQTISIESPKVGSRPSTKLIAYASFFPADKCFPKNIFCIFFMHAWCNGGNTFPDEWKMSSWCQDPFKDGKRFPFPNQQYCLTIPTTTTTTTTPAPTLQKPQASSFSHCKFIYLFLMGNVFPRQVFSSTMLSGENLCRGDKKRLVSWVLLAGTQSREGCCKKWLPLTNPTIFTLSSAHILVIVDIFNPQHYWMILKVLQNFNICLLSSPNAIILKWNIMKF